VARDVPWEQGGLIAEFGPGTGRITEALARRMTASSQLLLFEADPGFRKHLRQQFPGVPVFSDANQLQTALGQLGMSEVSAVVSGIPFTVLSSRQRAEILEQVRDCLAPGGAFVAYQFTPSLFAETRRFFPRVQVGVMPWNLPPMLLIRCTR
jgi:phospholipid N-methyltransferase